MPVNLNKTLTELEENDWGEPTYDSHLVTTCHQLRYKPLKEFTVEDLRIVIGQNISLEYLVPLAIQQLKEDILAEGDLYAGDLLKSVLNSNEQFWLNNKPSWRQVTDLYFANRRVVENDSSCEQLQISFERFKNIGSY